MTTQVETCYYREMDSIKKKHDIILEKYANKVNLIEEVMGDSLYLSDIIDSIIKKENEATGKVQSDLDSYMVVLYKRNIHYLIASYKLSIIGLFNPSKATARAFFEGVTQLYLLYLTEEPAKLFLKREMRTLSSAEKKTYESKYNYLSAKCVRQLLYDEKREKVIKGFYESISEYTHPRIKGVLGDIALDDLSIKDNFDGLIALGLANIFAIKEVYSNKFDGKIDALVDKLLKKVVDETGGYITIVPNKPKFIKKLKFVF